MGGFWQKYGALGLLLAATVFYAVNYIPAAVYDGINSDEVQVLLFYRDVFQLGHSASGWLLPGASDLFPEWSGSFLLNYFLGDGLAANTVMQVAFFFAWLILLFLFYRSWGGTRPEIFLPLLILVTLLAVQNNLSHVGTMLNTVGALVLVFFIWRQGSVPRYLALGTITFLGATSDALFMVTFVAPALAALGMECALRSTSRPTGFRLIAAIVPSAVSGYLGAPWVFPVPTERSAFTRFDPENIPNCLFDVWKHLSLRWHTGLTIQVAIDLLVLVGGFALFWRFPSRLRRIAPQNVLALTYTLFLVAANWAALLVSNNFSPRYVYFPLIWPPILAAAFISHLVPRWIWPGRLLALSVALYAVFLGLHPLPVSPEYVDALRRASDLRALAARENLKAGFAEYWRAAITTYISGGTVCLRPMAGTSFYHWVSNLQWIQGYGPGSPPPRFRYIVTSQLDPVALRARFGPPDEIVETSLHEPVWIYSEANAISYNPIFGELGNRHTYPGTDEATFTAAALSSESGHLQGTARIARAGRDPAGCITFGPYLHTQAGRYRADYAYTYLKPPAADKPVTFDCVLRLDYENFLDRVPIPYVDSMPHVLSRTFVVPAHPEGAMLELRLHYFESGDIEVDSLHITYLGPE
jgi:hypothetical protein